MGLDQGVGGGEVCCGGKKYARNWFDPVGHASVETTAIYTKVAPTDLARAVARAHPRETAYNRRRKRTSWRKGRS
jgi:hypothetical protein